MSNISKSTLYLSRYRKFGCEFEFTTDFDEMSRILRNRNNKIIPTGKLYIKKNWYRSENNKKWHLKLDSSTGCELTTPVSTKKDIIPISKILNKLDELNDSKEIEISSADALHIHMDVNGVPKHNLIVAWIQIEKAIIKCFPRHRRNNSFCQLLIPKNKKYIPKFFLEAENIACDHHALFSLFYYDKRKTAEFRGSEGTTKFQDVHNFVKLFNYFIEYAKDIDPIKVICDENQMQCDLSSVMLLLNIEDEELEAFLGEREKVFLNRKNPVEINRQDSNYRYYRHNV